MVEKEVGDALADTLHRPANGPVAWCKSPDKEEEDGDDDDLFMPKAKNSAGEARADFTPTDERVAEGLTIDIRGGQNLFGR